MKTKFFNGKTAKVMISVAAMLLVMSSAALTSCGGESSEEADRISNILENMVDSERQTIAYDTYDLANIDVQEYKGREAEEIDLEVLNKWIDNKESATASAKDLQSCGDSVKFSYIEKDIKYGDDENGHLVYVLNKNHNIAFSMVVDKDQLEIMINVLKSHGDFKNASRADLLMAAMVTVIQGNLGGEFVQYSDIHTKDGTKYRYIGCYQKKD